MFWKCGKVQIFGNEITNQNLIQEEIKRRMNLGNACYHLVQNLLSFHLLSKTLKLGIQNYNFACGSVCV
jgi:hypothetical protein